MCVGDSSICLDHCCHEQHKKKKKKTLQRFACFVHFITGFYFPTMRCQCSFSSLPFFCSPVLHFAYSQHWAAKCVWKFYCGKRKCHLASGTHTRTHTIKQCLCRVAWYLPKTVFSSYFQHPNTHYFLVRLLCDNESLFTDAAHFVHVRWTAQFLSTSPPHALMSVSLSRAECLGFSSQLPHTHWYPNIFLFQVRFQTLTFQLVPRTNPLDACQAHFSVIKWPLTPSYCLFVFLFFPWPPC